MRHYVYLADEFEAVQVVTGFHHPHEGIPPTGTQLHLEVGVDELASFVGSAGSQTAWYVEGTATVGGIDDWWHQTLGSFLNEQGIDHVTVYAGLAARFVEGLARAVGSIDQWPLIVKGTREANSMRWIKSMIRGTLGTVEDFQHQINWGKPGADPNPTEAELIAIGDDLAFKWNEALNATYVGLGLGKRLFAPDVTYTEVGVVLHTQTDPTDVDGAHGNLSQAYETHFSRVNSLTGVVGTALDPSLPYEVALAVSFLTDKRGPRGRGRTYLPPLAALHMNSGGVFQAPIVLAAGLMISHWIEAVKADHDLVPVVVSRREIQLHEIKQIIVGAVPDSQRRRRWHQLEASQVAWTHA